MKIKKLICIIVLTTFFTACPRYDAIRRMSSGLLDDHQKLAETLNKTFVIEDQFIEDQLTVTISTTDDLTRQIQAQYVARAQAQLDADPSISAASKSKILMDMAVNVSNDSAVNEAGKRQIQELTAKLKQKHKDISDAYAALNSAEAEMDQYIQLKKADELVFERIFDKIHISTKKITDAQTDIGGIITGITNLLPKKATVKP